MRRYNDFLARSKKNIGAPFMRIAGLSPATQQPITLEIRDGTIGVVEAGVVRADLGDSQHFLAAGMIDAQHNGYLGHAFADLKCTVDHIKSIIEANWRTGTTHFYPTLYTNTDAVYTHALRTIDAAAQDAKYGRAILGVHVEGPYLSPVDGPRGSHMLEFIREPNIAEFKRWHEASGKRIKLVTVAPEINGALDFIRAARKLKVKVSLGHHNATGEQIQAAIAAGADMVTHLGNGAHRMINRFHNYIFQQLAEDRLYAGMIADGEHLPDSVLRIFFRTKPRNKIVLVSDVVSLGGLPPGSYTREDGQKTRILPSGRVESDDESGNLAGAGVLLDRCIPKALSIGEFTLAQCLDLASLNPARYFKQHQRLGSLAIGKEASLFLFKTAIGQKLDVTLTMVAGEVVYDNRKV